MIAGCDSGARRSAAQAVGKLVGDYWNGTVFMNGLLDRTAGEKEREAELAAILICERFL
jgi:hypothetical protein